MEREKDVVTRRHIIGDVIATRLNVALLCKILLCVLLLLLANLLAFEAKDLTTVGLVLIWGLYTAAHVAVFIMAMQGVLFLIRLHHLYKGNYRVETDRVKLKQVIRHYRSSNTYYLVFKTYGVVRLHAFDYYKWSDYRARLAGVYDRAEVGEAYSLIVVGKKAVVMFYSDRYFVVEDPKK